MPAVKSIPPLWLWTLLVCLSQTSCVEYVTKDEFLRFIAAQKATDERQNLVIEDTAAKLSCSDRNVQDFVRRCREAGSKCDTSQITSIIAKMRSYHHRMLRLPQVSQHELSLASDDQRAELVTLFTREHNILPSTKLLLAVPSHVLKTPPPPPRPRWSRKAVPRQPEVRMEPDISNDNLAVGLRNLRKQFISAPYGLSEKIINGMEPQIPSCETRSDELIRLFRDIPANRLNADEQKIRAPYIDLIIFMVDCQ